MRDLASRTGATAAAPVLGAVARSATDIVVELRREFERVLFERYGQPPGQDPVLATLFHATAVQLARVYAEAEQVFPEAVFDDLVSGLGMPPRAARPAQTVIGFTGATAPELLTADLPLVGTSPTGEHLVFSLDVPLRVGPSQLVFAGVAEGGRLHVVPGATLPRRSDGSGEGFPLPSAVAALGAGAPPDVTLYLAFSVDAAPDAHLGGLGLFLDMPSTEGDVIRAFARASWRLLADRADDVPAPDALVLRARTGPGGTQLLDWQQGDAPEHDETSGAPVGVYGPLCWRWPEIPASRRVHSHPPRAIAATLRDVVPLGFADGYARPLVWVEVALPPGARGVAAALQRVVAHAAPASNLEPHAERVDLPELGPIVAFEPEGARDRHLVSVLGITGERGARYADETEPALGAGRGRFIVRGGALELRPAPGVDTPADAYAMLRLLYTDGEHATALQPGDVVASAPASSADGEERTRAAGASLVVARGGAAPPAYAEARIEFAERLRSRERVVTPTDLDRAARAFDARISGASVRVAVERAPSGAPRRIERVTVQARSGEFADPTHDVPALARALEAHLVARMAIGAVVRVDVQLVGGHAGRAAALAGSARP